jgi:hypothetical protein
MWGSGEDKLEPAHPDRSTFLNTQARSAQQHHHFRVANMAMAVKVREEAMTCWFRFFEVNGKHAPARLQHPPHLGGALFARFAG